MSRYGGSARRSAYTRSPCGAETTKASTAPRRMASSVSSGSARRFLRCSISAMRRSGLIGSSDMAPSIARLQVESDERALGVREVSDDLTRGRRELPHQGGNGKHLVSAGELR